MSLKFIPTYFAYFYSLNYDNGKLLYSFLFYYIIENLFEDFGLRL